MSIPKELEQVMKLRGGSVLGKKTILKSDHFPGCQNKRLSPQIDGAPNYRQADSLCVHGVAIPTIVGIHNVLKHIGAQKGGKAHVLWINLREEPVVYINGRPFVLRDVERPFSNLEYTGINRDRVEQMEARLKEDILLEAARYGNKILVTDELPDGQMVDQWERVSCDSVKTPLEVYEELQVEGYLVDYERVPITDEKSPKELDFDIVWMWKSVDAIYVFLHDVMVNKISQADISTEVVFNCQMGRGRTTTGMVIATLAYLNRIGASGIPRNDSIGRVSDYASNVTDNLPNSEDAIRRGEYAVIRSLIRVLEGGVEGKRQVDKVIDKCSSMQNLREAIATYRNSILRQPDEMKREAALSFFVEYLERYYFLICFAVYIHSERAALRSSSSGNTSFADWMKARPELYSIIRRLLRRDPMGALGYASLKPSLTKSVESADRRPHEVGVVAAMRSGEVLGSQTVLKSDHCPGCQNVSLPERVEGAPNFREVPGFPVFGVANPTIDGIRSVLQRIGSSKGGRPVFWHNMREEPVVYINGKPFVLREVERPYKNMLEYSGIDRERVERMEARLKEDILREAESYEGAIMVIHETKDGQIFDAWEHVNSDSIQTPLEVFKSLEGDGFPIKYARVPITDGKAPKSSDFDRLAANIASASKDTAFVFNCQMGRGRTTTGTVIACLVKLRIDYGRPIKVLPGDVNHEQADGSSSSGEESGSDATRLTSSTVKVRTKNEQGRAFGIDDILLLWKITRLFDNGVECREVLDAIIDRCSALQNIRQAVLHYRKVFNQQHIEPRVRRVALNRGAEYLERYFRLIAFAAYLGSEAFDSFCGQGECKMSFKNWLHQRPEVQAMKWSIRLRPGRFFTVPEELRAPHELQHGDAVMEAIVKTRNGSVLGKGSILKMYFFPGQRTSSHIQIHGAPHVFKVCSKVNNFLQKCQTWTTSIHLLGLRLYKMIKHLQTLVLNPSNLYVQVDGYPVYSMATPTITGAKEMLAFLGARSIAGVAGQKVVVTDLREEAVVYINGTPFVLRELNKPVDTLKHVGITGPVVEHMEARLKDDILSEVRQSGGRMLLHREEFSPSSNQSSVVGYWENIFTDDVKTAAELYAALKDEGYNIEYRRIPLTREREALASDVDEIQNCQDEGTLSSSGCYLYVSHTGFGGVAYAMAIICCRLDAEVNFGTSNAQSLGDAHLHSTPEENLPSWTSEEEARRMGDYRDILSLTRVLMHGPKSKANVDTIIESNMYNQIRDSGGLENKMMDYCTECAGAGHLRDDILHYCKELEKVPSDDDENRAYIMDMGIKAMRRYFFLITFRSYLYSTSPIKMKFTTWMDARPELGHLCNNLRIDK
ncbi:paladin-like [Gossypium australe]|uniref:Paladin-like n=1 Tax=Gossypium australe TaxID=47621 RepID=A0A5B6VR04_9ROSI|nr:paladin-like [Gossypium australe]